MTFEEILEKIDAALAGWERQKAKLPDVERLISEGTAIIEEMRKK